MKARRWRKIHRFLGLAIGVQLFLWTLSGLIFSWNSIDKVRGEHLVQQPQIFDMANFKCADINMVLNQCVEAGDKVVSVLLRMLIDRPVYELEVESEGQRRHLLVDARSLNRISPITAELATDIARADFAPNVPVRLIEKIDSTDAWSEYRGKELPAFRIEMKHDSNTVIYISANRGVVTARRNDRWRVFDFFWMLHTMDYQSRDNFNHLLLKAISAFGLLTVLSGFVLWAGTSRLFRRTKNRSQVPAG